MWLFLSGGLLMPADTPLDKADPKLTNDGMYTMQVRGRVESHLTNFIRDYMEPMGLPFSDIEKTPQMDYNVRFYTTPEAFAAAIGKAVLDIDYKKFKPSAERKGADGKLLFKDGIAYHSVLNSIWGTVTRLGAPGGKWSSKYGKTGSGKYVGSSFEDFDDTEKYGAGYYDSQNFSAEDLLKEAADYDVPTSRWGLYFTKAENKKLAPYRAAVVKAEKALAKMPKAPKHKITTTTVEELKAIAADSQ